MNLDEAQKAAVRKWIEEGLKLSEIQNRLEDEFGLVLTYMEARFLLDDLRVAPKDPEPASQESPPAVGGPAGPAAGEDEEALPDNAALPGAGKVSVTVDQLARPGAMISGKVTFSDGHTAEWYLDQMGRLGVGAQPQGYKPSQADLMAFQAELQQQLARMGYA